MFCFPLSSEEKKDNLILSKGIFSPFSQKKSRRSHNTQGKARQAQATNYSLDFPDWRKISNMLICLTWVKPKHLFQPAQS